MAALMSTINVAVVLPWLMIISAGLDVLLFFIVIISAHRIESAETECRTKYKNFELAAALQHDDMLQTSLRILQTSLDVLQAYLERLQLDVIIAKGQNEALRRERGDRTEGYEALRHDFDRLLRECNQISEELKAELSKVRAEESNSRWREPTVMQTTAEVSQNTAPEAQNGTRPQAVGTERRLARQKAWRKNQALCKAPDCFDCRFPQGYCASQ